jgi:hypothetical protein
VRHGIVIRDGQLVRMRVQLDMSRNANPPPTIVIHAR